MKLNFVFTIFYIFLSVKSAFNALDEHENKLLIEKRLVDNGAKDFHFKKESRRLKAYESYEGNFYEISQMK